MRSCLCPSRSSRGFGTQPGVRLPAWSGLPRTTSTGRTWTLTWLLNPSVTQSSFHWYQELTHNKRIQPTPVSSLRSSPGAADPCRWASGKRTSVGRVPRSRIQRIGASPAELPAVASVLEEKTGSAASPVDLRVGVLTKMQRRLHRALLQQPRVAPAQVSASCSPGMSWCSLTPNQSLQPTSHSSLRSSCAAAELHR